MRPIDIICEECNQPIGVGCNWLPNTTMLIHSDKLLYHASRIIAAAIASGQGGPELTERESDEAISESGLL